MDNEEREISAPKVSTKGSLLEFKHIVKFQDPHTKEWKIDDNFDDIESKRGDLDDNGKYSAYAEYPFLVRRKQMQGRRGQIFITTEVIFPAGALQQAVKDILSDAVWLRLYKTPLKISPDDLVLYLDRFRENVVDVQPDSTTGGDPHLKKQLNLLVTYLESAYMSDIKQIQDLIARNCVLFSMLPLILRPGSIMFAKCSITSEPRAYRLVSFKKTTEDYDAWELKCEYTAPRCACNQVQTASTSQAAHQTYGTSVVTFTIKSFDDVVDIKTLDIYPLKFHASADDIRATLISRGSKWETLTGIHHLYYDGLAFKEKEYDDNGKIIKGKEFKISGRVVIDRHTISRLKDIDINILHSEADNDSPVTLHSDLSDEDRMLAPSVVYGFSLSDKRWLSFNVNHVRPIRWNDKLFDDLVLDPKRKDFIIRTITSKSKTNFDDFVAGKGLGLIINLSGPPGVGKTLTVEATSEHMRKPLYVVSSTDLGTDVADLEHNLSNIFTMAAAWDGIVLIDEADVYMEHRSTSDLDRNAVVSVFLRQLEYFRGILFLASNRSHVLDEAFKSRIDFSLRYEKLSTTAKRQIWGRFLDIMEAGNGGHTISAEQITLISHRDMDGRKIKNTIKLALSVAAGQSSPLEFNHILQTLDILDQF